VYTIAAYTKNLTLSELTLEFPQFPAIQDALAVPVIKGASSCFEVRYIATIVFSCHYLETF